MKKLILTLLVLSFFFLLIYASSEPSREHTNFKAENLNDILLTSPRLGRLRACAEDEFNCNVIGEDYTKCVKKFKICDHQIKCSNGDQLECPLCSQNYFYCDLKENKDKCVELKSLCLDGQAGCSFNQTNIENVCEQFKLSLPNSSESTDANSTESVSSTKSDSFTESTSVTGNILSTENILSTVPTTIELTSLDDLLTSSTINSTNSENERIILSTTKSAFSTTTSYLATTTEFSESTSSTKSKSTTSDITQTTTPSSNRTSAPAESTKRAHSGPRNIMDYSKMFKHDYGGFNFSDYVYKGNKKGGKFNWNSFMSGGKNDSSKSAMFDYSKFMSGGGYDYSQYFGGGQTKKDDPNLKGDHKNAEWGDYSKYMNNGAKTDNQKNTQYGDYSNYMKSFDYSQYTGGGGKNDQTGQSAGDYSKYMKNENDKDGQSKDWGVDSYHYSAYKKSGLNSKESKGSKYQNDMKSGQKNQDKYAKNHSNYSNYMDQGGNQTNGFDSYYSNYLGDNQTNYDDYSNYTNQQASSKVNLEEDVKIREKGDLKIDTENEIKDDAIENTKNDATVETTNESDNKPAQSDYSKYASQYTSGGSQNFDYSKYLKSGNSYYDFSKYMSGHQGRQEKFKGAKGDDLINLTGSRQPTKSFSQWFDYSKYLKPGGHQSGFNVEQQKPVKAQQLKSRKQSTHQAPYLRGFKERFVRLQEQRQEEINKQSMKQTNENPTSESDTNVQSDNIDPVSGSKIQSTGQYIRPLAAANQVSPVQLDPLNLKQNPPEDYHHISMQNQRPKFEKQPSVNVSKIIPNMMSNTYNYTHYGSGVFFINFGTIVNGNNNINGDGNDVGNGNGNGNNNGNTQGDNMRGYDLNGNASKSSSPSPPTGDANMESA